MDENFVTLIVGLGGIVSTLISGGLGIYFVAKSRISPHRELLYTNQFDLVKRIICILGRIRIYLIILKGEPNGFEDRARDDVGDCIHKFSILVDEGAAILPTDLWIEIKKISDFIVKLAEEYDSSKSLNEDSFAKFSGMDVKIALLARSILGIDELSDESIKLFSTTTSVKNIVNIEATQFEKIYHDANRSKDN